MKLLQLVFQLILFSLSAASAAPVYSKPRCEEKCGNVIIPYPFGFGRRDCYLNDWFAVRCDSSSNPHRPYLGTFNQEVLAVSLENQTVTINSSMITSDCGGNPSPVWSSRDLGRTPFLFSRGHNKFKVVGCGNALVVDQRQGNVITGCSTICNDTASTSVVSSSTRRLSSSCYGINCCQSTLPYYLQSYKVDVTGLERRRNTTGGGCGGSAAFLVDENLFRKDGFGVESNSYIPVTLLWILTDRDVGLLPRATCYSRDLDLGDGISKSTVQCQCGRVAEGNPYLRDGECQVVDECANCAECRISPSGNFTCMIYSSPSISTIPNNSSSTAIIILGVSVSIGVLLLKAGCFWLYIVVQKAKDKRRKARFFKRNGGLLLQQQVPTDASLVETTKVFTARELEKATDYFCESRILGRGGQGTVYKGMLTDGRIVAVKKSKLVDESQLEQFINEVVILSQINHRNIVKLLGCCLETEVPLLVYEYISNGTLFNHIHDDSDEFPLSWNMRLQIAADVAGALAYLHSAASIPIYHRDIKSTNILLDDKQKAKVSDFGTSRSVAIDQTHLTTSVKGTFGYFDPEYFQSSQFTEKSDVYSFGVVLVELLTGQRPITSTRTGDHRGLATHFILSMEDDCLFSILDPRVVNKGANDELMAVANLANRCLNMNGKNRPTMKEVAVELDSIKMFHTSSSTIQTDIPNPNVQDSPHPGAETLVLTSGDPM